MPWFSANFLMEDVFPELEIPSTTITFVNANTFVMSSCYFW